jgi:SWI/SNF-related matrix-associated actin-dependent regulator 1 of chromatin subfamily A
MKLVGEGKWSSICQFIDSFLDECDRKLLVFGVHRSLLTKLSEKYKCDYINGSTPASERLEIVNQFKVNKKRVLFGNIQSLGTGVDGLQDICSNLLFIELPSTRRPSDIDQPIGRIERIGQKSSINVYYLLGKDTIDEVVWEDIENKREVTDMVNKGRKRELDIIFMKKLINRFGKI